MWEDNGLFGRILYHAGSVVQINGGPVYHYNKANLNAMTSGYGLKQVNQMINIAANLEIFFSSKSDGDEFKRTVDAFKYLARINLITSSFQQYRQFKKTFPESKYIAKYIPRSAFSMKGYIRFKMVKCGMSPLFILLFKIKNLLSA